MYSAIYPFLTIGFSACNTFAASVKGPARDPITSNVFELTAHPYTNQHSSPSSQHLARRRNELIAKRQNLPIAKAQEDLIGLGGRIYIANVTLGGKPFSLVIDSGSSDTWVATSDFQCDNPYTYAPMPVQQCGFGPLYNAESSSTFKPVNFDFGVNYTGGEFLEGQMGTELFGIGGVSRGKTPYVTIRQTIGAVNEGYWIGDGVSSGLMGLGFPALARGINTRQLNYTSVIYTLFQNPSIPPIFTLALNRPTTANPKAGGYLAIGGIPDIPNDGQWVSVPILPYAQGLYAFYSITVDGFDITPPTKTASTSTAPKPTTTSYAKSPQTMLLDSGTSLLYFPDNIAAYIASLFSPPARYNSQTNTYIVSCTAAAPRIGVIISGHSYFISEDDLMNKSPGAVGGSNVGAGKGECALAVQQAQGGTLVLGDTWLKNVMVVFDVANATDIGPGGTDKNKNGAGGVRIVGREKY